MKMQELLDRPERWIKGHMATTKAGKAVYPYDPEAASYCFLGAMVVCYPPMQDRITIVNKILPKMGAKSIAAWNDAPERTFADVQAILKEFDL